LSPSTCKHSTPSDLSPPPDLSLLSPEKRKQSEIWREQRDREEKRVERDRREREQRVKYLGGEGREIITKNID